MPSSDKNSLFKRPNLSQSTISLIIAGGFFLAGYITNDGVDYILKALELKVDSTAECLFLWYHNNVEAL